MGILTFLRDRAKKTFAPREGRTTFVAPPRADYALVVNATAPRKMPRWRQLRYAGLVFSGSEQRAIAFAAVIAVIAGSLTAYAFVQHRIARTPASGGKIVEAVVGYPKTVNPLYASTNDPDADLVSLVFAGLFRRADGQLVNGLAETYEWSSDGKQLTLTLREGLTFHDGTPLTSDDVIFTFRCVKDPAWRSPFAGDFRDASFNAVNERTITVTLGSPDVSIMDALTIGILPAHVWGDIMPQNAALADANIRPIGAGPFKVTSYRRGSNGTITSYALERFDGFYGDRPFLSAVELRFYPDPTAAEDAVRGGQADAVAFVQGAKTKKFPKTAFTSLDIILPQETIAFFNVNDPILKDSRVREALLLAVDRDDVVNALGGFAAPVGGPYPEDPAAYAASSTEERLAAARKLLDAAGWTLAGDSDIRMRGTNATTTSSASSTPVLALTITVPDVPDLVDVANVLARQWSLLNARTTVTAEPSSSLLQKATGDRTVQIVVWNILLPPTEDLYSVWWSGEADGRGLNLSNLKDRDVDAAIKAFGTASSSSALADAKRNISNAILARSPAAFLVRPTYAYVFSKRVQGVSNRMTLSSPSDRFSGIASWYVKTSWDWK